METTQKKFEVKQHYDAIRGVMCKDIFVNDVMFEYEIDMESLAKAKAMGPQAMIIAYRDLQRHFLDSLSDFLGRKITEPMVQEAIKTGWI